MPKELAAWRADRGQPVNGNPLTGKQAWAITFQGLLSCGHRELFASHDFRGACSADSCQLGTMKIEHDTFKFHGTGRLNYFDLEDPVNHRHRLEMGRAYRFEPKETA